MKFLSLENVLKISLFGIIGLAALYLMIYFSEIPKKAPINCINTTAGYLPVCRDLIFPNANFR